MTTTRQALERIVDSWRGVYSRDFQEAIAQGEAALAADPEPGDIEHLREAAELLRGLRGVSMLAFTTAEREPYEVWHKRDAARTPATGKDSGQSVSADAVNRAEASKPSSRVAPSGGDSGLSVPAEPPGEVVSHEQARGLVHSSKFYASHVRWLLSYIDQREQAELEYAKVERLWKAATVARDEALTDAERGWNEVHGLGVELGKQVTRIAELEAEVKRLRQFEHDAEVVARRVLRMQPSPDREAAAVEACRFVIEEGSAAAVGLRDAPPSQPTEPTKEQPRNYCPKCDKQMVEQDGRCNCGERLVRQPHVDDICSCGHRYGAHKSGTTGPCSECSCAHWTEPAQPAPLPGGKGPVDALRAEIVEALREAGGPSALRAVADRLEGRK